MIVSFIFLDFRACCSYQIQNTCVVDVPFSCPLSALLFMLLSSLGLCSFGVALVQSLVAEWKTKGERNKGISPYSWLILAVFSLVEFSYSFLVADSRKWGLFLGFLDSLVK